MLPESLNELPVPAALAAWDADAVADGWRRLGEVTLVIAPEKIVAVSHYLKSQFKFRLNGITGVDRYPMEPRFEVVYLLHSIDRNERLRLKVLLGGAQPEVDSVCEVWSGANWYERETFDLFGIVFRNHPDLRRIMMPDNWDGHPLRKDFPVHGHKYSYQQEG